jgi:hypothetical protein
VRFNCEGRAKGNGRWASRGCGGSNQVRLAKVGLVNNEVQVMGVCKLDYQGAS